MIPPSRTERLADFQDQLRRDEALSNLRTMQYLQQTGGLASTLNPMATMQTPMMNMNEGGLVSLPVTRAWGGFNPFKAASRAVRGIGKGIGRAVKKVGKGLSGVLGGITGGGSTGDMLKTMALMSLFSMMGAPGGMKPHVWRAIYGGFGPGVARGKLKFDPTSAAMTVGGGYLGDKLTGPAPTGPSIADIGNLQAGANPGTMSAQQMMSGGIGPSSAVNLANVPVGGTITPGTMNPAELFGNPNAVPTRTVSLPSPNVVSKPSFFSRNVTQPFREGIDYARDIAATEIPGAQTLKDIGQTDVGLTSLNELNPFGDKYNPFSNDMLFPDAAPNIGRAVAGATAGYEGSGIYDEQAEAEQAYKDWLAQQEREAEAREMPTREWLARLEDDPLQYRHTYRGPLSLEELIRRAREGIDSAEEGRQYEDIAWETPSGRESGEFELGARYGGYLPEVKKAGGGLPSLPTQQFFSGRVPNTVDPRSDGMSDSETMLITDQTGRDPRGLMKISEQEYVVSAPDMALLGNGDPVAGAQHLDEFRQNLRQAAYGTKAHQPRINSNSALQSLAHRAFG